MADPNPQNVYSAFAEIYDQVMRDVDYDSWSEHLLSLAKKYECKVKSVLDLACGTGNIAFRLARKGYRVVGVDRSEQMLKIAREKARARKLNVTFFQGSLESFSSDVLDEQFDLATCIYDSLNYLLEKEDVTRCFLEVAAHLRDQGMFIFDVTTEYNLLHNFSGYTFAENLDDASYIWENDYNLETKVCSSKVTVFQSFNDRYLKHEETHVQRVYATSWLIEELMNCGFEVLGTFHNMTQEPIQPKCDRIHFVCRKK